MLFHLHLHTAHTNRRKNTGSAKIYCDAQSSHHLTFPPSLCHLSSNPYNQLNGKEISMFSFHATEDQVWHFNLEALAGHTQNNALVRKTNLSPCYKNKQPQWKLFFFVYIHFCLNQKSVLLVFTWMALLCREKPAFNVPSNRPIESVLRSKGVTSVTYFAPDQGFSRPIAHSSVSPPTPSKTTSNLEVEKRGRQSCKHLAGNVVKKQNKIYFFKTNYPMSVHYALCWFSPLLEF